ncbi:MAG: elongation factor Ts [Selenomonas sp.]|jgi:elongation factor Ts|nr:elongation factor Ts [Selenomonas sp.]MCI7330297.1 translation elongation factor Ts [Selenomonadaceae bacterium]MDD7056778.1 translation elongation factor Ts [Selenomonadaceae bacterium]MDY3915130.1 translation elongation factor Ts [Selenomonadaceae bacterium]
MATKITAAMVKELREKTGAGMMDCKKALTATDGDAAAAVDWLREKGIAKAAKKSGRVAAEGAVGAYVTPDGKTGAVVEINCETDFAAGNEQFKSLLAKVAQHIAETKPADLDALNNSELDGQKVSDIITNATATIGEKISLRRFACYESAGRLASYIHMGGKIGVLVNLTGGDEQLGKDVAMQIAAAAPIAIDETGVPADVIDHEKDVARKTALEEGKPEKIVDRIVEGRIKKFLKEVCLIDQIFVKDSDKTIKDILGGVEVKEFTRFMLGEGIEKKEENFAAEVAAQIK